MREIPNDCQLKSCRYTVLDTRKLEIGWGGRIRTSGCEIKNLVTYRFSTPQGPSKTGLAVFIPVQASLNDALFLDFSFVLGENNPLYLLPRIVVQRMGNIFESPVFLLPARHRHEEPVVPFD